MYCARFVLSNKQSLFSSTLSMQRLRFEVLRDTESKYEILMELFRNLQESSESDNFITLLVLAQMLSFFHRKYV